MFLLSVCLTRLNLNTLPETFDIVADVHNDFVVFSIYHRKAQCWLIQKIVKIVFKLLFSIVDSDVR